MASTLITNISELTTFEPDRPVVNDAAIVVDNGLVAWVGPASGAPEADHAVDAAGRAVIPGFVDSHSHLVFAGDRSREFTARMAGEPYAAGSMPSGTTWAPRNVVSSVNCRATASERASSRTLRP